VSVVYLFSFILFNICLRSNSLSSNIKDVRVFVVKKHISFTTLIANISAVNEAIIEVNGVADNDVSLAAIDAEIAKLKAQVEELTKMRTRREIDALAYNDESCGLLDRLDDLFAEREAILGQRGAAMLDKVSLIRKKDNGGDDV